MRSFLVQVCTYLHCLLTAMQNTKQVLRFGKESQMIFPPDENKKGTGYFFAPS